MIGQVSVAAATAIVGYDLCRDQLWKTSNQNRVITQVGLAGSTAVDDTKVILYVGTVRVGELYNTTVGVERPKRDDMIPMAQRVPAGLEVSAIVEDAPATNAINLTINFLP